MITKQKIKEILVDQQEEAKNIVNSCHVEREVEAEIKASLSDKLVKVISGVRRCGKSVLAHRVLHSTRYGYVNFDDERLISVQAEELNLFLEVMLEFDSEIEFILLDEIQNVDGWELFANRLQRNGYKVIITGSNAHLLSRELATHLTGRYRLFEVFPFSWREHLQMNDIKWSLKLPPSSKEKSKLTRQFDEYFNIGGFPEITHIVNRMAYLQDLYDKVLLQDIAMRHGVRQIKTLKDIAQYVACNFSAKLSYKNIKNAFAVGSIHTVKNYLQYMEDAFLFFAVEAFSHKQKEKVLLPRKMYCIDSAMVIALSTSGQRNTGRLLENLIFIELLRRGKTVNYFVDSQNKYEVDFVYSEKESNQCFLIQVCADIKLAETKEREVRGLINAGRNLVKNYESVDMQIITFDYEANEEISDFQIMFVPAWKWLLD